MDYKNNPNAKTLIEINKVLEFIRIHAPSLKEKAGSTKWSQGHTVFCFNNEETDGAYVFMIGALKSGKVTWHMMPLYGVEEVKEKYTDNLKPFQSGKSCIQFKSFDDLPLSDLEKIVSEGTPLFEIVWKHHKKN